MQYPFGRFCCVFYETKTQNDQAYRHGKMILLYNACPHVAKPVKEILKTLEWDVLTHLP